MMWVQKDRARRRGKSDREEVSGEQEDTSTPDTNILAHSG